MIVPVSFLVKGKFSKTPKSLKILWKWLRIKKSMQLSLINYANTESLLQNINACDNNPEKLFRSKIDKQTVCGYSLFIHCLLDSNKSKQDYCKGQHSMKICANLWENATETINCKKKEKPPLAKEEKKSCKK